MLLKPLLMLIIVTSALVGCNGVMAQTAPPTTPQQTKTKVVVPSQALQIRTLKGEHVIDTAAIAGMKTQHASDVASLVTLKKTSLQNRKSTYRALGVLFLGLTVLGLVTVLLVFTGKIVAIAGGAKHVLWGAVGACAGLTALWFLAAANYAAADMLLTSGGIALVVIGVGGTAYLFAAHKSVGGIATQLAVYIVALEKLVKRTLAWVWNLITSPFKKKAPKPSVTVSQPSVQDTRRP